MQVTREQVNTSLRGFPLVLMWSVGRIIDLLGEKIFFPREEKKRWPGLWL